MNTILSALGFFIIGVSLFPILFYFQHLMHLPIPNVKTSKFHIHHSFYGLLLILGGISLFFMRFHKMGVNMISLGLGFIVHHEYSEPGLKKMNKFIYINKAR